MDWTNIVSAILAGGLAGQLTTLLLGQKFQSRRERETWLRNERFKVYSELMSLISDSASRDDFKQWPDEIRVLSQKVHLLCHTGTAPEPLSDLLQKAFSLALDRKLGKVNDLKSWRYRMRAIARDLRTELASALHS